MEATGSVWRGTCVPSQEKVNKKLPVSVKSAWLARELRANTFPPSGRRNLELKGKEPVVPSRSLAHWFQLPRPTQCVRGGGRTSFSFPSQGPEKDYQG